MYRQFMESQLLDISRERMEVAPTAHYSMGGIVVVPRPKRPLSKVCSRPEKSRAECTVRTVWEATRSSKHSLWPPRRRDRGRALSNDSRPAP